MRKVKKARLQVGSILKAVFTDSENILIMKIFQLFIMELVHMLFGGTRLDIVKARRIVLG